MATVGMTPILILATTTPATTGTPAPRYRAALILPIAPSVTSPTTRRPGRISATMVCGILAHKSKKRAAQPLFFMLDTYHGRQSATEWVESSKLHILRAAFLLAASASGA